MGKVKFRDFLNIVLIFLTIAKHTTGVEDALMVITSDDVTIQDDESDVVSRNNIVGETFEATDEWQIIKPGQAIPAGLHVQMNLATGLKQAKLLKPEKENPVETDDESKPFSPEMFKDLKNQLRKLPNDETSDKHEKETEELPRHFKTMDELKLEFDKMNVTFSTESELMMKVLKSYNEKGMTDTERVNRLIDLEYYVHQYDNAKDFIKMGGLSVATLALNSSVEALRRHAAFLLGSAMQSNPSVQISCLEGGVLHQLLHLLTVDESTLVKTKALYALSGMLRQFPYAQKKFLDLGGLNVLSAYFRGPTNPNRAPPDMLNLQLKIVTLMHDLVLESLAISDPTLSTSDERRRQYENVNIIAALVEQGFCEHIPALLIVPDHVSREKVLNTMLLLVDSCGKQFLKFTPQLALLQNEYANFASSGSSATSDADDSSDADYLKELHVLVNTVITKLPLNHEEL